MLAGVVEIDNLNGVGEMQGHKIPNPFGAVTDHDLLECAAPAASVGFRIDSPAKLFRTLDGSGIRGGIGIADWIAVLIPRRLCEDASKFDFPSMGRLTFRLALPTDRLFLHHRNSRPIHLHVQDANRLAGNDGAVPTGGLSESRLVRAERYRLRWPPPYARLIWWSLPGRPELSSVRGRDRRVPPGLPSPACGVRRERIRYSRYPVRHPPEIGRRRSVRINSKGVKLPPRPRRSARAYCAARGSGLVGRRGKPACALPRSGLGIGAVGSTRRHPPGVEPSAWPSRSLPDRCAPCCADPGTRPARTALLRARSLVGPRRPFFFQLRFCLLFKRPQTADLGVGSQKLTSELLVFPELLHFSRCFLDRRRGVQRFRDGV